MSSTRAGYDLGAMPLGRPMHTVDEALVRAPIRNVFDIAKQVELWPAYLTHYRKVRFRERRADGGGLVEMSAYRPFPLPGIHAGPVGLKWPTWWLSEMSIDHDAPAVRFRHVGGITTGMDVEWSFTPTPGGTHVRILHVWDGPRWPLFGMWAATNVIGPVFVHGIASRTLAGLAKVAEQEAFRKW